MKKIIILLLSCFLFAGCYDYNELNNAAIVSGIAASYKNEKYNITFETIVTKKSESNSSDTKTMLVSSSGKTPAEAFDNTIASVDKKAVFSHLKVVILDETIAKKGIKDLSIEAVNGTTVKKALAPNRVENDGNTSFNLVISNIPKAYYNNNITARAYVCIDGMYFYSNTLSGSFSEVSNLVINDNEIDKDTKNAINKLLEG